MSKSEKEFELLTGLGLTSRQSKIYLVLAQLEMATAKTISRSSGVRRENVYRIIPQLQEIGLIEKIIDIPTKFRAIEIKDAVLILLDQRNKYTNKLQKTAQTVIKNFKTGAHNAINDKEKAEFILIPKNMVLRHRKIQSMNNAKKSADIITTLKRAYQLDINYLTPVNKAVERGVTLRTVIEKPEKNLELPFNTKSTQKLKEHYYRIFRYPKQPISNEVFIFDRKEVYIFTIPNLSLEESPALWSNNSSLVDIAHNYFEMMWNDSLEFKQE